MRGPQDYGGLPAGLVDPVKNEHEPTHWERRVDAIMLLLFDPKRRLARVDESRRMQEALGDDYHKYPYYERWLQAITWLLLEKGVFSRPIIFEFTPLSFKTFSKFDEINSKLFFLFNLFNESLSTIRFLASGFNSAKDKSSSSSLI